MALGNDPTPIRIWRDPTRRDVEELCRERGGELAVRAAHPAHNLGPKARLFVKRSVCEGHTVDMWIGFARKGERPDWRDMLKRLGSTWA